MSAEGPAPWPGGARGTLCLSFDNLGEAAEIGVGALAADAPGVGSHPTATVILPHLLDRLDAHGLAATFFVEGLNAELYPDLLRRVDARGHEVAYHAWAHEQWGDLTAAEQARNLARGAAAFRAIGLEPAGMRPPGGRLGKGGLGLLREAGLSYCSPAGTGAGVDGGVALLPFDWRHVDVTCTLPQLATVRERTTGSPEPLDPDRFLAQIEDAIGGLAADGGFAAIVMHPFMLDWLGEERMERILDRAAAAAESGAVWVAPCREVARRVLAGPAAFERGTRLDPTSWSG
jgi:peptidoglycan/xylan/chitin deacetylase (PgdA/CDA1 family)